MEILNVEGVPRCGAEDRIECSTKYELRDVMPARQPEELTLKVLLKEDTGTTVHTGVGRRSIEAHRNYLLSTAPVVESCLYSSGLRRSGGVWGLGDAEKLIAVLLG